MGRGLEDMIWQQRLRNLNLPRFKKRRLREDLIALLDYLMVSYREDRGISFSEMYHEEKEDMIVS